MCLDNKNLAYGRKGGRDEGKERERRREEARVVEQVQAGPCRAGGRSEP